MSNNRQKDKQLEGQNFINLDFRFYTFLALSIIFIIYSGSNFASYIIKNQIFNYISFGVITILLTINTFLFFQSKHKLIWKYIFITAVSIIILLKSSPFSEINHASLIILSIPIIAFSICIYRNALIVTIFFLLLYLIIFIQKLFLNYYNPDSVIFSAHILILYIVISGLIYLIFLSFRRRESAFENQVIIEKNRNSSNVEILKKFVHQLRTSANNIVAITDFLKESREDPQQQEYIDTIITSINTIVNATKKLDNLTYISINEEKSEARTISINNIVQDYLKSYVQNKKEKQFFFTFNPSKSIPKNLIGIPEKLKQLLFNIFETISINSESFKVDIDVSLSCVKETQELAEVLIEIHTSSIQVNALDVEIDDTYSRLYNYFSNRSIDIPDQEDKEFKDNYNIILSKNLANHLGGEIGINFKDPNIIVFWMNLPLMKIRHEEKIKTSKTEKEKAPKAKEKEIKESKILVVEDNHLNQRVLTLGLKDHVKGIDIANNGKEAIEMFSNNKYDIILMDLHLPVLDGFKATEKIRELEADLNIHTPIIGLSAILMDGIIDQCKEAGLDEYISKPYNISKLKERIIHYLNS